MTFSVDLSSEFGVRAVDRLEAQTVAWLTTVSTDGTPQPNPVWYLWNDGWFLIFSQPNQAKLKNIARHPRASLNLEAVDGDHVTVFTGAAELIDRAAVDQELLDRYAARYAQGMAGIKMTRAEYEATYTAVIRFTPEKLRGW